MKKALSLTRPMRTGLHDSLEKLKRVEPLPTRFVHPFPGVGEVFWALTMAKGEDVAVGEVVDAAVLPTLRTSVTTFGYTAMITINAMDVVMMSSTWRIFLGNSSSIFPNLKALPIQMHISHGSSR